MHIKYFPYKVSLVFILSLGMIAVAAAATLEEIVVTAQKRKQSLQDVSAAVSAVGMDRLTSAKINNLEDLQFIVPSITLGNDFNMAKVFIRGVGANTSTTGSETGVAMHVDGVFIARAEAQLTSLFDLQRVEVLRGPQGSLYGRNAVGGSINLITARPTHDVEGYAHLTYGNYDALTAEGAIGGPITDNLLGRVAFKSEDRSGFGKNPVTGNGVDDLNRKMARVHLEYLPNNDWDVLLTGEWYHQDDASRALKYRRAAFPGVPRLLAGAFQPVPPGLPSYAANPRDLASEVDPATFTDTWSISGHINWKVNDQVTLTNITNYRYFWTVITQDLDLAAVQNSFLTTGFNTTVQRRDVESRQYSTEFQFKFNNDFTDSVLGLFYFNERQRPVDTVGLGPNFGQPGVLTALSSPTPFGPFTTGVNIDGANVALSSVSPNIGYVLCNTAEHDGGGLAGATPPPKRVCIKSDLGTEVFAVFGQARVHMGAFIDALQNVTLKLGGRYSWEKRTATNASEIVVYPPGGVLMTTADGSYNKKNFKDFTPEVGLEWRATPDMMLYYTYSEGFKAGAGENAASPGPVPFTSTIVKPEKIKNHEFGLKSTWFENRLSVNLAGYFYDLRGQQINKTIAGGPAGFSTIFENAAKTSAHGIELEFSAVPTDDIRFSGAVSYLKSRYDDFLTTDPLDPRNISGGSPAPPDPATDFDPTVPQVQLKGNPTRNSPEWTANLHGEYNIPGLTLPYGGKFTLMGDVSYRGDTFFTEFHRFIEGQKSYTLLDFNVRYTSGNDRFFTDLWIKNATNEFVASSTFQLATARVIGVTYMPPRTYGVTVGFTY